MFIGLRVQGSGSNQGPRSVGLEILSRKRETSCFWDLHKAPSAIPGAQKQAKLVGTPKVCRTISIWVVFRGLGL